MNYLRRRDRAFQEDRTAAVLGRWRRQTFQKATRTADRSRKDRSQGTRTR